MKRLDGMEQRLEWDWTWLGCLCVCLLNVRSVKIRFKLLFMHLIRTWYERGLLREESGVIGICQVLLYFGDSLFWALGGSLVFSLRALCSSNRVESGYRVLNGKRPDLLCTRRTWDHPRPTEKSSSYYLVQASIGTKYSSDEWINGVLQAIYTAYRSLGLTFVLPL